MPSLTNRPKSKLRLFLTGVITLGLVLLGAPAMAYSPPATSPFTDVPTSHASYTEIAWMYESGISTGWSDGTYRPNQQVDRDAMAAFFYRFQNQPAYTAPASCFSDISPSIQFYKEMCWMKATGISTGWDDGTYRPWDTTRRDAMAAFIYRAAGSPSYTPPNTSPFSDITPQTQFFKEMMWLAEKGIATSVDDGTFNPLDPVTREMMAIFMYRLANLTPTPWVTTNSLPAGVVGSAYSATLAASSGTPPYTWSASGLPSGLGISSSGTISGTPTAAGAKTVTVTVTDSQSVSKSKDLTININNALAVVTNSLPAGVATTDYSANMSAQGGVQPYKWTASGLPSGLGMSSGGQISGTTSSSGGWDVTVTVTDADGRKASKVLWLEMAVGDNCDVLRCIAITFDDGPLSYSDSLLNSFTTRDAEATFFLVGSRVKANPAPVGRLANAGMEVGMHGWDHVYYTNYGYSYALYDFDAAATAIENATGDWPSMFRPPYGYYNPTIRDAAGDLGMATIMWTDNTFDYEYTNASTLRRDAVDSASRNSVILMHDGYAATASAMPGIIDDLKAEGYTLVTVSKLLGHTPDAGVVYFDDDPVYH